MNKNIQRKRKIHRRHKRKQDLTNALIILVANRNYINESDKLSDMLRMVGISVKYSDGTYKSFNQILKELSNVWKLLINTPMSKRFISTQMVGVKNRAKFEIYMDSKTNNKNT